MDDWLKLEGTDLKDGSLEAGKATLYSGNWQDPCSKWGHVSQVGKGGGVVRDGLQYLFFSH